MESFCLLYCHCRKFETLMPSKGKTRAKRGMLMLAPYNDFRMSIHTAEVSSF